MVYREKGNILIEYFEFTKFLLNQLLFIMDQKIHEMKKSNFSFNSPFCIIASASTSTALASATYSLDQRNFNETLRITLVWIFLLTFLF